jgi:hypothetical protein
MDHRGWQRAHRLSLLAGDEITSIPADLAEDAEKNCGDEKYPHSQAALRVILLSGGVDILDVRPYLEWSNVYRVTAGRWPRYNGGHLLILKFQYCR